MLLGTHFSVEIVWSWGRMCFMGGGCFNRALFVMTQLKELV